jgi:streptogramin lyase
MKRWAAIAAMLLALLGVTMAPASADPTNTPNAFTFPITCGGTTYTVVGVPGQGQWTPALVTDSNQVFIPFSFDITFTDLTTGESFSFTVSKEAGNHLATQSCSFSVTDTDPETGHLVSIVGTVEVVLTPPAG